MSDSCLLPSRYVVDYESLLAAARVECGANLALFLRKHLPRQWRDPPHRPGRALISASGSYLGYERPSVQPVRTLSHPCDTRRPALCRVRARWQSVLLDQQPSLLTLRQQLPAPEIAKHLREHPETARALLGES